MRYLTCFLLATIVLSCGTSATQDETTAPPVSETSESFGADFNAEKTMAANRLLTTYAADQLADTVTTTLRGTVNEVCQAKGCWMTIAAGDAEEMTVKFKDYGFFVPKDISGREVIMNGMAYYQVTPVDELRHYAEDAGKTEAEIAAITEPKKELRFLADGVKLVN